MKKILIAIVLILLPTLSFAQSQRNPCYAPFANSTSCVSVSSDTPLPVVQGSALYSNITTNANTVLKTVPTVVSGLIVNTAGVTSSVVLYDNTTCTGTIIGTFSTLAQVVLPLGIRTTVGLCATTAGGTPANITVTYN